MYFRFFTAYTILDELEKQVTIAAEEAKEETQKKLSHLILKQKQGKFSKAMKDEKDMRKKWWLQKRKKLLEKKR